MQGGNNGAIDKSLDNAHMPLLQNDQGISDAKRLEFQNFDVSQDKEALDEMKKISGGLSVPVIVVDGSDPVVGFKKDELEKLHRRKSDETIEPSGSELAWGFYRYFTGCRARVQSLRLSLKCQFSL